MFFEARRKGTRVQKCICLTFESNADRTPGNKCRERFRHQGRNVIQDCHVAVEAASLMCAYSIGGTDRAQNNVSHRLQTRSCSCTAQVVVQKTVCKLRFKRRRQCALRSCTQTTTPTRHFVKPVRGGHTSYIRMPPTIHGVPKNKSGDMQKNLADVVKSQPPTARVRTAAADKKRDRRRKCDGGTRRQRLRPK